MIFESPFTRGVFIYTRYPFISEEAAAAAGSSHNEPVA